MATLEFDAVVEGATGGGARVSLPADAAEVFGTRARFPVQVTCNGTPYRGSTMPMGGGTFCLGLTKAVRASAGVDIGDPVHVVVVQDPAERTVEVPEDLAAARADAALTDAFDGMAYTHRKEYARWVTEAKRPETRTRRVQRAVEMIAAGERFS